MEAPLSQGIDVRGLDLGPKAADIRVAHVIGHDQ
jgi:hypothetical protein